MAFRLFRKKENRPPDLAWYSDMGGRSENEDSAGSLTVKDRGLCASLADGLGGHGGGKTASLAAVRTIEDCFQRDASMDRETFERWFSEANQAVLSCQTPECRMKTTLVVLRLVGGRAAWAHVGDSRLYHFYNGVLTEQTVDHSVSQMAVFRGEITQDEIRGHEDRNRLLRALGSEKNLRIDVREETELSEGRHAFLLCSDGFWEYVLEREMEETLAGAESAEAWLREMQRILGSRAGQGNDNNTAVAVIAGINWD